MNKKPLLLIVDDSESQRRLYGILADRIGVQAHIVKNCADALTALDLTDFDLILMDWLMPDQNGGECLPFIREKLLTTNRKQVPVICVTARAQRGDREMCLEAGMDDYLSKPFTIQQLQEMVDRWLPQVKEPSL